MNDTNKIRFIATSFVNLQGLRNVPIGIFLLLFALLANSMWANGVVGSALWANGMAESAKYFIIMVVLMVGMIVSLYLIDKYYYQSFGKVKRTSESSRFEWLIQIVGSILLLGAAWIDITLRLPVSCIGLVFATVLIAEYLRLTWLVGGRFLLYYPLGAIIIVLLSILPLFGITKWWLAIGLENELVGFAMVAGIFSIVAGMWGHLFLLHVLSPRLEVTNDHTI